MGVRRGKKRGGRTVWDDSLDVGHEDDEVEEEGDGDGGKEKRLQAERTGRGQEGGC